VTLKLVYPTLAMILWIFVVLGIVFLRRKAAFANKEVKLSEVAISTERYPDRARLASANFSNQFESPVVFFAIIMLAMEVNAASYAMAALAWGFVATRVIHTLIHVGANNLKLRAAVFAIGIVLLFCMWVGVVVSVL